VLRVWSDSAVGDGRVVGRYPGQLVVAFSQDGSAVYVRTDRLPIVVSRVELSSGAASPHLVLPTATARPGLSSILNLHMSRDGAEYAYSDSEELSHLYVVDGLTVPPAL
jgi:hypothetical protein